MQTAGGNVGIGTASPTETLDVAGNIKANGSIESNGDDITIRDDGAGADPQFRTFGPGAGTAGTWSTYAGGDLKWLTRVQDTPSGVTYELQDREVSATRLFIDESGRVGIRTAAPTAALHVTGTAGVDGIRFPDGTLQTTASVGGGDTLAGLSCTDGQVAKWDATSMAWECASDEIGGGGGGGDISAVIAGSGLAGGGTSGDVTLAIAAGGVTSVMIADGAVAAVDLATNSVSSATIVDGTVASGDLANNSVTSAKIVDATITADDLGTNSVAADEIATGAVGASEIASNAVGSVDLASDSFSLNKVSGGVMTILAGSVGIGTTSPIAELHIRKEEPVAGTTLLQLEGFKSHPQIRADYSNGTVASPLPVAGGDLLLSVLGQSTYSAAGGIGAELDIRAPATWTEASTPAEFLFRTTAVGSTARATRMTIEDDGDLAVDTNSLFVDATNNRVGIANATPSQALDVTGNIKASGTIQAGSSIVINGTTDTITASSGTISFDNENLVTTGALTVDTSTLVVDATNNRVGIGTAAPAAGLALDVVGNVKASGTIKSGSSITIDGTAASENIASSNSLELRVAAGRALRLETNATAPNIIGGFSGNTVTAGAFGATIGGGGGALLINEVRNSFCTVGGGRDNIAGALLAGEDDATVSGGRNNTASSNNATVGGGFTNTASGIFATVGGGDTNTASGSGSTIPGGEENAALGDYSFAAGRRAKANHHGTFVWADRAGPDFISTAQDQFLIRATGGVGIGTNSPDSKLVVSGSESTAHGKNAAIAIKNTAGGGGNWYLRAGATGTATPAGGFSIANDASYWLRIASNGRVGIGRDPTAKEFEVEGDASKTTAGSWGMNSDQRIKKNVETVGSALDTLDKVRLVTFEYTDEYRAAHPVIKDRTYMNVIAQEFAEVFPDDVKGSGEKVPGTDEEMLQVDPWPLTIYSAAAVQELHQVVKKQEARIAELEAAVSELLIQRKGK